MAQKLEWQLQREKLLCLPGCVRGLWRLLWQQGLAQYGCVPARHMALQWKIHRGEEMNNAAYHTG